MIIFTVSDASRTSHVLLYMYMYLHKKNADEGERVSLPASHPILYYPRAAYSLEKFNPFYMYM